MSHLKASFTGENTKGQSGSPKVKCYRMNCKAQDSDSWLQVESPIPSDASTGSFLPLNGSMVRGALRQLCLYYVAPLPTINDWTREDM